MCLFFKNIFQFFLYLFPMKHITGKPIKVKLVRGIKKINLEKTHNNDNFL